MMHRPLPLTFEDRTGQLTNSDFDDLYDRLFFHVSRLPGQATINIHEMNFRASRHRSTLPIKGEPIVRMCFGQDEGLGWVEYMKGRQVAMNKYLRKTAFFGGSLSRKFVGSDGREYKWGFRTDSGQEWTCTTMDNYLVAHYDLKPLNLSAYDVSGNTLTIYEPFQHIAPEVLATLIMMRHIAQFNL